MKLKKISNTDTFEISGTLIISDFKEAGILKSDGSNYQLLFNTDMDYEERINQCQFITAKGETLYLRNGILSRHTINFPGSNEYEYLFTQIWVSISHTEMSLCLIYENYLTL